MREVKRRLEDLYYAIRMTETAFRNCSTPSLKDLYLRNIKYYHQEIILAEIQLIFYNDTMSHDQ